MTVIKKYSKCIFFGKNLGLGPDARLVRSLLELEIFLDLMLVVGQITFSFGFFCNFKSAI